ncbi:efflux RND transporter permease subunit [Aliikangiella maris]|uniref:Efflux RND transporter permease subunit n=2 Tax=Aliikangiella maris TaxID=3162458 RepID=A0ABV3MR75_9GAMM
MHQYSIRLFSFIIERAKLVIVLALLCVCFLSTGLTQLSISNDFKVYLSKDNPQLKAFEKFEANYVKSDSATFVITAKEGDVFTAEGLKLIAELTAQSWQLDYAYRVSSLSNYQYTRATDDTIETRYLYEDAEQLSLLDIANIQKIALSEKRLLNNLLTQDGKLALIAVNLNLPEQQANASILVTEQAERLRDQFRLRYPTLQIDNGGSVAFNTTLARAVAHDLQTLLPLSYLIIFGGLFWFLRSLSATLSIFILISTCLLATFGLWGWFSPVLTPIAGFAPSILLSIMVADSVHIIVNYLHQRANGMDKKESILSSLQINRMPVLITSVTTIIGFLSLNFSASPPYQDLGNMVAIGVAIALIFSFILLPAMLTVFPDKEYRNGHFRFELTAFSNKVISFKKYLLVIMIGIACFLILFIPQNKLSDNWSHYFDENYDLIKLVKRIDGYLSGINALEYSLHSKQSEGIFNPDYLQQLAEFEEWLLQQDKVFTVRSFNHLMKDLNQVMHNDDPVWYRIPQSAELAAQYLLFYELGLPDGLGLDNLVTMNHQASRLTVSVSDMGSDELLRLDRLAQDWLNANAPAIETSAATGLGVVFAHIAERNIEGLLQGTVWALIGISIILMLILKSIKFGLISLIPNIVPAAMAYGVWGMTFGYVDISLSIVACSTLGIVVDDTVHFLHKYILARKANMNTEEAIKFTFNRVGGALLTTSAALSGGFLVLALSNMNTSATIGLLMAITLVFALIVDFLLLPPLLLLLDKGRSQV